MKNILEVHDRHSSPYLRTWGGNTVFRAVHHWTTGWCQPSVDSSPTDRRTFLSSPLRRRSPPSHFRSFRVGRHTWCTSDFRFVRGFRSRRNQTTWRWFADLVTRSRPRGRTVTPDPSPRLWRCWWSRDGRSLSVTGGLLVTGTTDRPRAPLQQVAMHRVLNHLRSSMFCGTLLYSIPFYSILLRSILFHFILLHSNLFCLFHSTLFHFVVFYSILFYYVLFHSTLLCSILFHFVLLYSIILCLFHSRGSGSVTH